jgi:hypothetical protein
MKSLGRKWLPMVAVLLLAGGLRVSHMVDLVEWPDEIWTVWQASLNLHDGLVHTDPYWPPLFGTLVWGWMHVAGTTLEAQRYLSVLIALLAVAVLYRAALELSRFAGRDERQSRTAALLAALTFTVMGYAVFAGVDVRAYGLLLLLLPLNLWLTLRWLVRPGWRRAVPLCLAIALLLHAGFSSLILIPYFTLFVVVVRPRLFLRWVIIGFGVLVLVAPIIPQFIENNVLGRLDTMRLAPPPFPQAMADILRAFGGSYWFLIPLLIAAMLILVQAVRHRAERKIIALLVGWALLFPVVLYVADHDKDFWQPRYLWWVATGLALLIGYALARLRRPAVGLAAAFLVLLPAAPVNFTGYQLYETASPPFRLVFSWLARQLRPGDVMVIDPRCACGKPTGWDLFVPQYFPTGYLPIVEHPGDASRVWYLSTTGWPRDDALLAEVEKGRKPSIFVGPWFFLLQLYEGPPSWDGADFGGKIHLDGVEVQKPDDIISDNETVQVKLWWSAAEPLARDYSFSLAVLDSKGRLVAQADGPPQADGTPGQTSQWQPGTYYEDFRDIHIPSGIQPGDYALVVTVYQWWDGVRLKPTEKAPWTLAGQDNTYLKVDTLRVPGPF